MTAWRGTLVPRLGRALRMALGAALLTESRCPGCNQVLSGLSSRGPAGASNGKAPVDPGASAANGNNEAGLCWDCLAASVAQNHAPETFPCPGCGEFPANVLDSPVLCGACRVKPRPWQRTLVYGPYDGPLRELLLAYKFLGRLDVGRQLQGFALAAYERAQASPERAGYDALVPVPLHPRRLLVRGFNQSREIARLIAARHGLPIWQEALVRVRRTVPQMQLERQARAENILGAFAADNALLAGRCVLLVDDIMTTGATLEECARVMKKAGAARVDVLVLARA